MEAEGQLNIHDSVDIYCLNECFMPLIKNALAEFTRMWNRHKITTAGVMSPIQLNMIGLFKIQRRAGLEGEYFKELEEVSFLIKKKKIKNHRYRLSKMPASGSLWSRLLR